MTRNFNDKSRVNLVLTVCTNWGSVDESTSTDAIAEIKSLITITSLSRYRDKTIVRGGGEE